MAIKHVVILTLEECSLLEEMTRKNKVNRAKLINAFILLKADEGENGEKWKDEDISKAYNVSIRTVERLRKRFVEEGFELALNRKKSSRPRVRKIQGEEEAKLITLCCSQAPTGHARWTLRLLADKMVELEYIDSVSYRTIGRTLKKTNLSLG